MNDWREQEVENETRSREINERIDESNESEAGTAKPFVCECSDGSCTSLIDLTHVEYEEVRAHGTHFAIATDHESPDLDLMVSERSGFAIIRKLPGLPARIANASDPRRVGAAPDDVSLVAASDPRCPGGRECEMNRPTIVAGDHKGDDMRGIATSIGQRPTLAPYQNRSCVRCGEHTIFVLDDPAGGWYACIKCGRYA